MTELVTKTHDRGQVRHGSKAEIHLNIEIYIIRTVKNLFLKFIVSHR